MEIIMLAVGKTSTKYIEIGIDEYLRRLTHYIPFRIKTLPDLRNARKLSKEQQKESEGKMILDEIASGDLIILLDEKGEEPTSKEFSEMMGKMMLCGKKRIIFIIGGPYGFSESVYSRADRKLALSRLTFSHEMVRLFFVEQIYRAMTIMKGEPYHHE